MDTQVNVTLTALNGDLSIAERNITLNSENDCVPIGRASKSITKGIHGAIDNAWFDSPVMSRNHAEMELNTEDMTITIKDIGSMHGTYLNDIELPKHSPMVVSDGDVLVFGAEVRRGPETYPACTFRINYKFGPYKAANTFTFPESSDVDDEGEENYDEFSEDDMEIEEREHQYSSEDGVSIESPPQKSSQAINPIDLTGDDFPGSSVANSLDLTGETDAENRMMNLMAGRPADIDGNADPMCIGIYAGNPPIVVDAEDDDAKFDSDLDDQSGDNDSEDSDQDRVDAIFEDDIDEVSESENEGSVADSEEDNDVGLVEESDIDLGEPATAGMNNLTRYAVATDKNPVIRLSDVRTRTELPDSDDEDDGSDFGLSEAGAEGMRALYGESAPIVNHDAPEWECEGSLDKGNDDIGMDPVPPQAFPPSTLQQSSAPLPSKDTVVATPQVHQSVFGRLLSQPAPVIRQPSPSDAAMVKSAFPPRRVSVCDLGETNAYTSQILGEKSGKSAFFAAREVNKAKFSAGEDDRATNTLSAANRTANIFIGETKAHDSECRKENPMFTLPTGPTSRFSRWEDPIVERSSITAPSDTTMFNSFTVGQSKPFFVGSPDATSSIPTRDYCSFLDKPDQSPMPDRAPSPLPDMTSSVNYNTSKGSMAAAVSKNNPRSAIKIPDIIESSSPFTRTNNLKRKSENISDVTDKELRNWARSNVSDVSLDITSPHSQTRVQGEMSESISTTSNASESRPTKRIKKLLENVGYIALGGATLFAALVATAPDLL